VKATAHWSSTRCKPGPGRQKGVRDYTKSVGPGSEAKKNRAESSLKNLRLSKLKRQCVNARINRKKKTILYISPFYRFIYLELNDIPRGKNILWVYLFF